MVVNFSNQSEGFTITGSAQADSIIGSAGDDTIIGSDNDTLLNGAGGVDTLNESITITVRNVGNKDVTSANAVTVKDILPAGLEYVLPLPAGCAAARAVAIRGGPSRARAAARGRTLVAGDLGVVEDTRFRTARDQIEPLVFVHAPALTDQFAAIGLDTSSNECLRQKLTLPAAAWTACGSACGSVAAACAAWLARPVKDSVSVT